MNQPQDQGEFIPSGKLKRIHLLQAELDSRPQMSYRGASLYFIWGDRFEP